MNRCRNREFQKAICLLAAGCLDDFERTGVQAHLAGCPKCRARFDEFRALCGLLSEVVDGGSESKTGVSPVEYAHPGSGPRVGRLSHVLRLHARVVDAIASLGPSDFFSGRSSPVRHGSWLAPLAAAACLAIAWQWHVTTNRPVRTLASLAAVSAAVKPTAPVEEAVSPTLLAYERAAAQSIDAFEALLEHSATTVLPPDHHPVHAFAFADADPANL